MPKAKKLPSGSWNCKVFSHYEYRNGKKVMVKKSFTVDDPTNAGKKECERLASVWAASKKSGPWNTDVHTAIRKYIDIKKGVLSPSTVSAYESYLKNGAFDGIGAVMLSKLDRPTVQRWVSDLARERSPKYVKNIYALFTSGVKMAGGPSFEVTMPKPKPKDVYTPTDAEISALIEYCRRPGKEELLAAVLLAAFGSMRRSEICALEPSDIRGNVVTVNKGMVRDPGGRWTIKQPKTTTSARQVVIPTYVIDLFPMQGPRIVNCNPDALTSRFKRAIKYSGMPTRFSIHALRHYYVSAAHALGIADAYTMKMGGWRTDNVMKKHYRSTLSDVEQREQEKLNVHTLQVLQYTPPAPAGHETDHKRRKKA